MALILTTACVHTAPPSAEPIPNMTNRTPATIDRSLDAFMGDGTPARRGTDLPSESYVEFQAKRLRKAKVLWVNFPALRELGIAIPSDGLTPAFEEQILEHFAYMVPNASDAAEDFTDETKTFFADRYGGAGIGYNGGSGRAGTTGPLQVKNIGQTPLRSSRTGFDHNHGGGSIKEAVQEAIWGEVANTELPRGANRVLFILDTGTYTHWPDGTKERRSLIVREDPLRPAHFIRAPHYQAPEGQLDDLGRLRAAMQKIDGALPVPRTPIEASERTKMLLAKIDEMYERQVEQMTAAHAKKIFHGALTPSNIEAHGRYLDYASVTATAGYVNQHADHASFPTMNNELDFLSESYGELHASLRAAYPDQSAAARLRSPKEMAQRMKKLYAHHLRFAFLEQLGFPRRWVAETFGDPQAKNLADRILALVAKDQKVLVKHADDFSKLKLHARLDVLMRVALQEPAVATAVDRLAAELDIPTTEATDLVDRVRAYFARIAGAAEADGVAETALRQAVLLESAQRNRNMPELYREPFKKEIVARVDVYAQGQDRAQIWNYIDDKLRRNKRTYRSLSPNSVVVSEDIDFVSGAIRQIVFDERLNRFKAMIAAPLIDGQVHWHQHRLPAREFSESKLRLGTDGWSHTYEVAPRLEGKNFVFEVPLGEQVPRDFEYVLGDDSRSRWWKNGERNFRFQNRSELVTPAGCTSALRRLLD